jgi:purine-binding chemotaxis protein CheW
VGDVLLLSKADFEPNPSNLPPHWAQVSKGVFRLEDEIMVVLNTGNLFGDAAGVSKESV